MRANQLAFFRDCKHHVMINHVRYSNTHVFNFISERPIDRGMILKVYVRDTKDNVCNIEYGLTYDNQDLASGQKDIKLRDLVSSLITLVNETF